MPEGQWPACLAMEVKALNVMRSNNPDSVQGRLKDWLYANAGTRLATRARVESVSLTANTYLHYPSQHHWP